MQATRLAPSPSVDPEATDEGAEVGPTGVALAQASRGGQQAAPWLVAGQRAVPLREFSADRPFGRASSLTELIEHWSDHESGIRALTSLPQTRQRIATAGEQITSLDFQAPIRPRRIFCTIGNYRRQVVEAAVDADDQADAAQRRAAILDALAQRARAGQPYVCLTSADRIGNPTGTLTIETGIDTLDWEVEIAVVVGAGAYRLSTDQAQGVIAGYCVANDLTIRSRVTPPDLPALGSDWLQSKGMAGSLPLGPWLVPAWQLPDPSGLRLRLSVNGAVMQNDTAEDMVFGIDRQVAYLSQHTALQPGDVLCTGSPPVSVSIMDASFGPATRSRPGSPGSVHNACAASAKAPAPRSTHDPVRGAQQLRGPQQQRRSTRGHDRQLRTRRSPHRPGLAG